MIYTDTTKKAIKLMFEAHKNQVDKSGIPYVFHPWHVAESMQDEDSVVVALLHDVVEDTNITIDDLKKEGFNSKVIEALEKMTHNKNTDYYEYIKTIGSNELATKVKIADLMHNMDYTRLEIIDKKAEEKLKKYKKSLNYLLSINDKNNKI